MGILQLYFILFNLASAAGWAYVGFIVFQHLHEFQVADDAAKALWQEVQTVLTVTQSLAVMEIVHSFLGITKSPFFQTFLQVASRIFIVYGILIPSEPAQNYWMLFQMLVAWSVTEVPRYLFYAFKQVVTKAPAFLFHIRYSMFYVLYPMGITGEMGVTWISLPLALRNEWSSIAPKFPNTCISGCVASWPNNVGCTITALVLMFYLVGGPVMVFAMHLSRKSAYKKRFPRKKKADKPGILFPKINGDRSTQEAGKACICAAISAGKSVIPKEAAKARIERNWRFGYKKHFKNMVLKSLESPQAAVDVAKAGLEFIHKNFEFKRADGSVVSFETEMERKDTVLIDAGRIEGKGKAAAEFTVPYKNRGNDNPLKGDEIDSLAKKWEEYGTIEPDAANSLREVATNKKWLDLSNHYFVLIGASSAMGPFLKLMELGANIIALDIPGAWERPGGRPSPWRKIFEVARKSGGKLIFPLREKSSECKGDDDLVKAAGANLLTEPADIKNWLLNLPEIKNKKNHVVIGNYTYLDGALHVMLSVAADSIMNTVAQARPKGTTTLAYLCTPTDMHVISKEASLAAESNYHSWLFKPLGAMIEAGFQIMSKGKYLKKNVWRTDDFYLVDGLVVNQGPNYALAKRLQHWRAILAYGSGIPVCSNIAPSTATVSVVKATTFRWAYGGIPYFVPYEVFEQDTTNAVMTAALIYDLQSKNSFSNPENKTEHKIGNSMEIFKFNSYHGGVWRSGYLMDSLGVPSVLIYFLGGPNLFVPATVVIFGALSAAAASILS